MIRRTVLLLIALAFAADAKGWSRFRRDDSADQSAAMLSKFNQLQSSGSAPAPAPAPAPAAPAPAPAQTPACPLCMICPVCAQQAANPPAPDYESESAPAPPNTTTAVPPTTTKPAVPAPAATPAPGELCPNPVPQTAMTAAVACGSATYQLYGKYCVAGPYETTQPNGISGCKAIGGALPTVGTWPEWGLLMNLNAWSKSSSWLGASPVLSNWAPGGQNGQPCFALDIYLNQFKGVPCANTGTSWCYKKSKCYTTKCATAAPGQTCDQLCPLKFPGSFSWTPKQSGTGWYCLCNVCAPCPPYQPSLPPCMPGWSYVPPFCYYDYQKNMDYPSCHALCDPKLTTLPLWATNNKAVTYFEDFKKWGTAKGGFMNSIWLGMNDKTTFQSWVWDNGTPINSASFGWYCVLPGFDHSQKSCYPWQPTDPDGITSWATKDAPTDLCRCARMEKAVGFNWMDDGCQKGQAGLSYGTGSTPGWDCVCQYSAYRQNTDAAFQKANAYTVGPIGPLTDAC